MKKDGILMITSETVPLAKSGGLADMVGALSVELEEQGQDVRIVMPRYYSISLEGLTNLGALCVPMGVGEFWCQVFETTLPNSHVPVYLLDHQGLYGRKGIYGPIPSEAFEDNALRYAFLSVASFQLCRMLQWIPQVMHCHDWVSGPVPLLLNAKERFSEFSETSSIMTIHNLGYQGIFPLDQAAYLPLDLEVISKNYGVHDGSLNYLKMGIENAQIVSTVSPTYAQEIKGAVFGHGLDGSLRYREADLFGVINGMDYREWNPEKDKLIAPYNFSVRRLRNKAKLKKQLQEESGLEVNPDIPLIGIISRLVDQKGFGDLCGPTFGKLYNICWDMDVQFIIVGTGEPWCEEELRKLDHSLENLKVHITYSDRLAHQVEGASDFFLMPSKYEPCGLNQLYSLRYGTLPIVRRTGGLADTVENYQETTGDGTGFLFDDLTPQAIYDVVGWAVSTYFDRPHHIKKMRKEAMKRRFSWKDSALRYRELYTWAQDRI
ncbi:MAG: glycogen/starch synthase [Spirochaetaceae bacterium]|jgi:starch synthase|nr:glycogen/starch synthase [Spirochaetaceae bacterium]